MWWRRLWAGRAVHWGDPHDDAVGRADGREGCGESEVASGQVKAGPRDQAIEATAERSEPLPGTGEERVRDMSESRGASPQTAEAAQVEPDGRDTLTTMSRDDLLRSDRLWYTQPTRSDGECVLIMGFDFGTSTSKIVVHAPFVAEGIRFLAEREKREASVGPAWLWPSAFFVGDEGICALTGDGSAERRRGIKIALMNAADRGGPPAEDSSGPGAAVTAYLALVLRTVRGQILRTHAEDLQTFAAVQWSLNLGAPSGLEEQSPEEESRREYLFKQAATAAWHLSLREEPIRLKDAESAFRRAVGTVNDQRADEVGVEIKVFPEVIAGALGYARGDLRRDGLHLAVDVGAGTVDVCLFILPTEDAPRAGENEWWPLLKARVKELGTVELHERRVEAVRRVDPEAAKAMERSYDPLNGTAVDPDLRLVQIEARVEKMKAEKRMRKDFKYLIGCFIQEAVTQLDPNSFVFRPGGQIRTLVMGGGSRVELYRAALEEFDQTVRGLLHERHRGMEILDAPVPEALRERTGGLSFRVAVAVGLSSWGLDLPRHGTPTNVPNVPKPERRVGPFVDKDQV